MQWREHCRHRLSPEGPFDLERLRADLLQEQSRTDLSPKQQLALSDLERYMDELSAFVSDHEGSEVQ
jgi:hypothetical protein